jgi:polar amino acid transport system substrate-binding protein
MPVVRLFLLWFLAFPVWAQQSLTFGIVNNSFDTLVCQRILKEAYHELDITIELYELPSKRSLKLSSLGEIDGELFRIGGLEEHYPDLIRVPTPISVAYGSAFTKNLKIGIQGWESLRPYRIGIQLGVVYSEVGTQGMNRTQVHDLEHLFRLLKNDRIDIAVISYSSGLHYLTMNQETEIHPLTPPIQTYPLFHYLHVKNQPLVAKLDRVIKRMSDEGRLNEIFQEELEKYIGPVSL